MAEVLNVWDNSETFKVILTFDNGAKYTAISDNDSDQVLESLNITETAAELSGNPVGIMAPNFANFNIIDRNNLLLPTNTSSPYYGYMRNGVQVNVFISTDEGMTWKPYGEYYTENWYSDKADGSYSVASLTCTDKLDYIGNKDLPPLQAYSGVNVTELLKNILKGIGLTEEDFIIDTSLSMEMLYAVAKGDKVRDALNTIAQSLLARIFINRAGIIEVRPAIPTKEIIYIIDDIGAESIKVQHNKVAKYNKVKLLYNKVDNRPSEVLISLNNVNINNGLNMLNNLQINNNVLSIDGVYITTTADEISNIEKIRFIDYIAYQGGIDIAVYSDSVEDFIANIEVVGKTTGVTDIFVESVIQGTDAKVANTLTLESYVIQDEQTAQNYVNKVAEYLKTMRQEIVITGTLPPQLTVQQYIHINSDDSNITGDYLITNFNIADGSAYTTTITAVKVV